MDNIAALIMVKNEQYFLPYVLESISGIFHRIVIYDIGSEDNTTGIIDWFVDKEKDFTDFFVRKLPNCDPKVQGALRNAMIAEARAPGYVLIDGDEIYHKKDAEKIVPLGQKLLDQHEDNKRIRYGLFRRIEMSEDLTHRYDIEREHHRLYTRDAIWTSTHPGERAYYKQNSKSECDMRETIKVFHFHNALRSPYEDRVPSRLARKNQHSYHPGKLEPFNLLDELPILRNPIEDWEVSPALKKLQNDY